MKKLNFTFFFFIVCSFNFIGTLYAQLQNEKLKIFRDNVKAKKMLMISEQMNFKPETEKAVFVIYEKYYSDYEKLLDKRLETIVYLSEYYRNITEKEVNKIIADLINFEKESNKLFEKYLSRYKKVLSPAQLLKFYYVNSRVNMIFDLQLLNELPYFDELRDKKQKE